jgi:hypothetical protein
MVKNEMLVQGVDLTGTEQKPPVILQMNDDDVPARFLRDLASPNLPQISSAASVDTSTQPLYQPVQRMLNVALVDLSCTGLGNPRIDPTRILSAGVVVRRAYRMPGANGGPAWDDVDKLSAWQKDPSGKFSWRVLRPNQADLDPDPAQRPQISSGQPYLDSQLALMSINAAFAESTTPAFAAPPAINSALNRTVLYAVIPTASSEVSDTPPAMPPNIQPPDIVNMLPALLLSNTVPVTPPIPGTTIDFRWMTDDFLNIVYPPNSGPSSSTPTAPLQPDPRIAQFHMFSTALRLLHSVFGAFDGSLQGNSIFNILNQYNVTFVDSSTQQVSTTQMGVFFQSAKAALLDYDGYNDASATVPTVTMPTAWDSISVNDQNALITAMLAALIPKSQNLLAPQGRFQDETRLYRLRLFFRLKPENPGCPPKLVWSHYSEPFRIAAWHESSQRPHPPISLPDPTLAYMQNAKPNCSFHVPANLMGAMQGSTLSGLMKGSGGGGGVGLGWICGFNIPLITICAFFVLNIFLSLLNIVFFWLPFIKICIPFPSVSSSTPDEGTP